MNRSVRNAFCVFIFLTFLSMPALAQQNWEKGVKVGIGFSKLTGRTTEFSNHRAGFCAGAFVSRHLAREFSLQGEILYTVKGGKEPAPGIAEVASTLTVTYLEIPLLTKLTVPLPRTIKPGDSKEAGGSRFQFSLGFVPAFKLDESVDYNQELSIEFSSFDVGMAFGGGFDIDINAGMILIDARYTYGLKDINSDSDFASVKNRSITLMVGYIF